VSAPRWNRNVHYHYLLLSAMPAPCRSALDVGCGDGTLLAKLAERADTAVGIDASEAMVERARRTIANRDIELVRADFLVHDFGGRQFDFITCVAALHHMDFGAAIARMSGLLRPAGRFAVLGLARPNTPRDFALHAAGIAVTQLERRRRTLDDPRAPLRDPDMTYSEVERAAAAMLPGVQFRRLLLCRYLLTWTKPE
jgi:ubiquinone/menaquinone biosynthesis C-methylase UbiE